VARIKARFQEKLRELFPFPKKYDEAKRELKISKAKMLELESELKSVLKELCKAKSDLKAAKENPESNESLDVSCKKLQKEVDDLKRKYCGVKSAKECLEDKLITMKKELEGLRNDSAKIITTTKRCAEKSGEILHEHINDLELELAHCRASASMSLSQKEETIRKMQRELNSLCGTLSDAQNQIGKLKDQISFLNNQQHKTRLIEMAKVDQCHN